MIPDDMIPDLDAEYRHRRTGRLSRVAAWMPSIDLVILEKSDETGRVQCSTKAFWDNYLHAKARVDDVQA
jgi:hypothetical protein